MDPIILMRPPDRLDMSEWQAAEAAGLPITDQRTLVSEGDLVIGRYSVLPFYKELETDIKAMGGKLINSYAQHQFIADLQNWVEVLDELTPKTWFRPEDVPADAGAVVIKGETNSRKDLWKTHMFASSKAEMGQVIVNLLSDSLISTQNLYVRKFIPLKRLGTGINGMPISEEYRVFVLYGKVLVGGFYWSNYLNDISVKPDFNSVPKAFLDEVIARIGNAASFYVVDVARTEAGDWTVIELNDGQMSGLSAITPTEFYTALKYRF